MRVWPLQRRKKYRAQKYLSGAGATHQEVTAVLAVTAAIATVAAAATVRATTIATKISVTPRVTRWSVGGLQITLLLED